MIEILKSILFGIVEGITEWLPVSSTGHMILLNELVKLDVTDEFYSVYEVVIQLGAILAVLILFWNTVWPFGKKNNKQPLADKGIGAWVKKDIFILWFHFLVSCIPAIIIGVFFDDYFEALFYNFQTVAIMLILVGIAFIVLENIHKNDQAKVTDMAQITYKTAFILGLFQVVAAVFPGTSRSGAIIVGALIVGIARPVVAEYAFCLAIPVMFGASLLKILKYMAEGLSFSSYELMLLGIGSLVAFLVSIFVIRFLMNYIRKHDFKIFGWYRIILGLIVLAYGIFR